MKCLVVSEKISYFWKKKHLLKICYFWIPIVSPKDLLQESFIFNI